MSSSTGKSVQFLLILLIVTIVCLRTSSGARRLLKNKMSPEDLRKPFVLLYEHESFRGKEYVQFVSKACANLPKEYTDWASSVDTHRSCASVCTTENCAGPCYNVYSNQGVSKLRIIGFNDKIKSVKSCF
ncbi:hypothetical protein Ocin01_01519 [Orchesella cincta]|uniref:Uncharacterized protein n=1 Tax=Orchesella cincta TaxID=48709 RepID=A0A1D2NIT6_ORCCI|nr:hypothetical protein Ocin01_01519 [Orchesella cincta]